MAAKMQLSVPTTPPRWHSCESSTPDRTPIDVWNTPTSTTKNYKQISHKRQKSLDHTLLTPEVTPQKFSELKNGIETREEGRCETSPIKVAKRKQVFGGRKTFNAIPVCQIFEKPFDTCKEENATHDVLEPSTPSKNLITAQKIQEWYGNSRNDWDDEEDYEYGSIYRERYDSNKDSVEAKLDNPFIDSKATAKTTSIRNLFVASDRPIVDYSTHTELVNHRTGAHIIKELPETSKRLKPKKLNFDDLIPSSNDSSRLSSSSPKSTLWSASNSPFSSPSQKLINLKGQSELNQKFVSKNLNDFINAKSKNTLDFQIFKDATK